MQSFHEQASSIAAVREYTDKMREAGKEKRAFIMTFGCQQNEADSEKIRGMTDAMGYARTDTAENADLIILNTCAIREHAELKALSIIGSYKHVKEKNPDLIIGVCGCMAAEAHRVDELKRRYPYVSFTLEPAAIHKVPETLAEILRKRKRLFALGAPDTVVEGVPVARASRHKAWLSIMYGCNNFCSYCIVPYVRGRERSRASADIIREMEELVAGGAKDITLLGQNVNSYSSDIDFPTLLERLDAISGEYVLRFMTSHPKDASDRLVEVMAKAKHIEPHFHLPLQSGSDRILKAMNRHYNIERYLSVVDKLRRAIPDIALTSDIIVGFPGETEEDFEATLRVLREIKFDSVYSFIYSPRKGTPAAKMENAVPAEVQSERFRRLLDLQADISNEKNAPYVGRDVRVLVDGISKNAEDVYSGRTDSGKLVHMKASEADVGEFRTVHIDRAESFALFGTIIE